MTVGLLGGTFDPIHDGHLDLARRIADDYSLPRLYLVPAYRNPLKDGAVAPAADRLAMARIAVDETRDRRLQVLDWEALAPGPSYTVVTVERLVRQEKADVLLVVGNEVFAGLTRWKDPARLLGMADVVVVHRDPSAPFAGPEVLASVGLTTRPGGQGKLTHSSGKHWIEERAYPVLPFSGTALREEMKKGSRPPGLRHGVWQYIKEKGLYAVS